MIQITKPQHSHHISLSLSSLYTYTDSFSDCQIIKDYTKQVARSFRCSFFFSDKNSLHFTFRKWERTERWWKCRNIALLRKVEKLMKWIYNPFLTRTSNFKTIMYYLTCVYSLCFALQSFIICCCFRKWFSFFFIFFWCISLPIFFASTSKSSPLVMDDCLPIGKIIIYYYFLFYSFDLSLIIFTLYLEIFNILYLFMIF